MLLEKAKEILLYIRSNIEKYYVLEEKISALINESENENDFLIKLDDFIKKTKNIILKTDARIFKNEFLKINLR